MQGPKGAVVPIGIGADRLRDSQTWSLDHDRSSRIPPAARPAPAQSRTRYRRLAGNSNPWSSRVGNVFSAGIFGVASLDGIGLLSALTKSGGVPGNLEIEVAALDREVGLQIAIAHHQAGGRDVKSILEKRAEDRERGRSFCDIAALA